MENVAGQNFTFSAMDSKSIVSTITSLLQLHFICSLAITYDKNSVTIIYQPINERKLKRIVISTRFAMPLPENIQCRVVWNEKNRTLAE